MERKQYEATRKQVLRDNRIILGARGASFIFWFLAVAFACLIVIALYWLLTQPTPAKTAQRVPNRDSASFWSPGSER